MVILIHTCPQRMWYVEEYLIPELKFQGFENSEIEIWNDEGQKGVLPSWVGSCYGVLEKYPKEKGVWHLQDDIVVCDNFRKRLEELSNIDKIINGFCCKRHNPDEYNKTGFQNIRYTWYSFQCVYIPKRYIVSFVRWFKEITEKGKYKKYVDRKRHADFFFYRSVRENYPDDIVLNVASCLVDHIDYLLNGSVITENKKYKREAYYWDEPRGILKNGGLNGKTENRNR